MARDFDFLSEQAYEDTPTFADLGLEAAVPTAATPIGQALPAGGAANAPVGIAALPGTTQAAPDYSGLSKQISDYWSQFNIGPTIKGVNRADELARLLQAQGITEFDPSKFRLKETKIMDPEYTQEGEAGSVTIPAAERILKQLTYGDKTFGVLGGYGSKGEFDPRTEEYIRANDALATSYAGEGQVQYVPVQDKQGNVIIVPKWASSSDIDPMMMQIIGMGLNFALPGLGLGLGAAGNAALAGGITGLIGSGGNVEAALKGAALGGVGGLTSQYLNPAVAELVKDAGLTGLSADIAAKALTTAGTSAARAAITGDSILDAATRGLGAGAAGAAASGAVNELGLPADIATYANPVLTAALLGQDPKQALISSLLNEATKTDKVKGYAHTDEGNLEKVPEAPIDWAGIEESTRIRSDIPLPKGSEDIDDLLNELYIDTASQQDQIEPTGTEVEDIERLVSEEQTEPSSYTDVIDLLGSEETEAETAPEPATGTPMSAREREAFLQANVPDQDELISLLGQDEWDEETNRLIQQTGGLKEEDFEVTQDGTIRSTYSGEEGRFDPDTGEFVPYTPEELGKIRSDLRDAADARRDADVEKTPGTKATAPKAAAPGATTPKTSAPSPKTAPAAQSQRDIFALMAAMGMMGDDDEERAQAQQLFDAGLNVKDIFRQYYG